MLLSLYLLARIWADSLCVHSCVCVCSCFCASCCCSCRVKRSEKTCARVSDKKSSQLMSLFVSLSLPSFCPLTISQFIYINMLNEHNFLRPYEAITHHRTMCSCAVSDHIHARTRSIWSLPVTSESWRHRVFNRNKQYVRTSLVLRSAFIEPLCDTNPQLTHRRSPNKKTNFGFMWRWLFPNSLCFFLCPNIRRSILNAYVR